MSGNGNGFAGNNLGEHGVRSSSSSRRVATTGDARQAATAAGTVGRGFFNDFDAEDATPRPRDHQFLIRADIEGIRREAPYALQICSMPGPA